MSTADPGPVPKPGPRDSRRRKPPEAAGAAAEGQPLTLVTAVDVAYAGIRSSILSGEFEPGSQLKLQRLANRYSISLIPVREALRLLEAEGLVESVRNKGARVAPVSMADALDVYRLRLILETSALKMAFDDIDDDVIETLQQYQRDMRDAFSNDPDRYLALHHDLHFGIYSRSGSKWMMAMLDLLWSHSERWRRLSLPRIDLAAPTEDHLEILAALQRRDLPAACAALETHISVSVKALEDTLPTAFGVDAARAPVLGVKRRTGKEVDRLSV
jgi:DNA-binding GntR family transcriptional regulator